MAILTPLDLAAARSLGALYGLEVERVSGIPAGSVNSNFELGLRGGARVFLRVFEEQRSDSAAREASLLDHLSGAGVPTPRPLSRRDAPGHIAEHAGKPVAVFPWSEGEVLCQARVTEAAARKVGAALARVHAAGDGYEGAGPSRFGAAELARRIEALKAAELEPSLARDVAELDTRLAGLAPVGAPAPRGLIHGDLFRDNVLWKDGEITALLDFESASVGSRAFDLMVTVLAWCVGDALDPALARALVEGYRGVRELSAAERAELFREGCFAALRFTITRITDFELRPRGTGVYKDYRRFRARLRDLEELGAPGLASVLGLT